MRKSLFRLNVVALLAGTAAIAADSRIDVSRIVDKAGAEAILGESVTAPTPRNVEGSDGYYSKCNYYSTSGRKRLTLRVYQAASGFDPHKELEAVAENAGAMRSLSGLGDKARITTGVQGGLPSQVILLYVVKGNTLVTVGVSGIDDDTAATDKVKAVAQKIIAEL